MKKSLMTGILLSAMAGSNALFGCDVVFAEEAAPEYTLEQMVVTATRTMKQLQEVPSSVSVVTAEDISERNATSVQEALQYIPGVYMNQTAQGGITLRGFSSTDVLVLVDGMQMNTTYKHGADLNTIPVESIERIEVLRGAASSLYGGTAVGGVINIITKEAKEGTRVSAALSYGSNNTWKKSLGVDAKVNDKWAFGLGYEKRESDGYAGVYRTAVGKKGDAGKYNANLEQLSDGSYVYGDRGERHWEHEHYNTYVKYNFDDSKSLKYAFSRVESETDYQNAKSFVKDSNGKPVYNGTVTTQNGDVITIKASSFYNYDNFFTRDTHALIYRDEDNLFNASFSYVNNKEDGYTSASVPSDYPDTSWAGKGSLSDHPGKVYNFQLEKAWENIGKHTVVVGGNFKQEEMVQNRYTVSNWLDNDSIISQSAQDKGKVKNFAIFVQDEYKLSEPVTMYLGARYDRYEKGSGSFWGEGYNETSPSEAYNEISPKIAFDFAEDEDTHYYVSYGHSFNPPPMYQIYRYSEYTKYWYVPNPALDPETTDTFELGMKKQFDENTSMNLSLYYAKTDDKIAASGILPGESYQGKDVKKYMNFDYEKRRGAEIELTHKFNEKFGGYLNYAWQQGKLEGGDMMYSIPKHIFHAGIDYKYDKWKALVDCQYISARQREDSATDEFGAEDAYFIVNTSVNYDIAKNMTVQFGITNLFDKEFYASEATSGRTYNVGLRYSF